MVQNLGSERAPLYGTIGLTDRCNLNCVHCFVHDPARDASLKSQELTTRQWFGILDQLADAGCLRLLWTGGEPLLRPDFCDLHRYAKRKGLLTVLFTNATLLTPDMVAFLQEWRPWWIEVTLYGMTAPTYERVTGVPGSFARCLRGIEMLREAGFNLRLKTMAMRLNIHELEDMYRFSADLGISFRHDAVLWQSARAEDIAPLRLSPTEVVGLDRLKPGTDEDFVRLYHRFLDVQASPGYQPGAFFHCGAGIRSFFIDPYARLSTCQMYRSSGYDLLSGSFQEGWRTLGEWRSWRVSKDFECLHCELSGLCQRCPASSETENGDSESVPAFFCEIAHLRANRAGLVQDNRARED
ncbi:MAG: radical SAM protein [Anaerolineae bacterium]|nr:radical SAM protein [Anaerolineae bacterium]